MQNYCRLKKSVSCIPKRNVKFQHVCALPERSLLTFVLAGGLSAKTLLSAAAFSLLVQQSERSTDSVSACIYAIQSKPQAAIMESFHSQNALFFQCIQCQRAPPPRIWQSLCCFFVELIQISNFFSNQRSWWSSSGGSRASSEEGRGGGRRRGRKQQECSPELRLNCWPF